MTDFTTLSYNSKGKIPILSYPKPEQGGKVPREVWGMFWARKFYSKPTSVIELDE